MNGSGKVVGRIDAIQIRNESVSEAVKGQEVAVSIDKAVVGRNLRENEVLFSYIPKARFPEFAGLDGVLSGEEKELLNEIKEIVEKSKEGEEE